MGKTDCGKCRQIKHYVRGPDGKAVHVATFALQAQEPKPVRKPAKGSKDG